MTWLSVTRFGQIAAATIKWCNCSVVWNSSQYTGHGQIKPRIIIFILYYITLQDTHMIPHQLPLQIWLTRYDVRCDVFLPSSSVASFLSHFRLTTMLIYFTIWCSRAAESRPDNPIIVTQSQNCTSYAYFKHQEFKKVTDRSWQPIRGEQVRHRGCILTVSMY